MRAIVLALLLFLGLSCPVRAQDANAPLRARAEQVVALLGGNGDPAEIFTPAFLAQIPPERVRAISRELTEL